MKSILAAALALSIALVPVASSAADKWGAIVVDLAKFDPDPSYGVGGGDTEQEAVDNGMKFCREAKGAQCKLVTSYEQCAAYAASGSDGAWGKAATQKRAEELALADCKGGCKVVVSDCN